jgi:Asp-tRNA(Asn)/Glu-tRNA(Gln) amidotransferase A subunit family amidase
LQEIWTLLHLPAMTLPSHRGPSGLPIGIQIIGARNQEQRMFPAARWIMQRVSE